MKSHTILAVCAAALLICPIAPAQEVGDIAVLGPNMQEHAAQGEWASAYDIARGIVAAQPEDLAAIPAEERYYIGLAHAFLMAEAFEAADDELEGEQAEFAARMRQTLLAPPVEPVRRIAFGEEIEIEDYLVEGQTVIVNFTSEYCPPCVAIAPRLTNLAEQRDDVLLVNVDINRPDVQGIDFQSPVARQFGIRGIPHFQVYGPDGEKSAEGPRARELVTNWLRELEE